MKRVLSLLLLSLVGACAAGGGDSATTASASEAWSGPHCPIEGPAQQRLSPQQWQRSAWKQHLSADQLSPKKEWDLLILRAGSRPTAGYRLSIEQRNEVGDALRLELAVKGPKPDTMVAQVMTSPCLALWVPKDLEIDVRWLSDSEAGGDEPQKRPY